MKTNINSVSNSDSDSGLLNRTAQRMENQPHRIDFRLRFQNRALSTEKLLDVLYHETPRFWELAQVVGKWVWIQFEDKQPPEITAALSQFGFHWNRKRQTWHYPCGQFRTGSHRDPRDKYQTYFPADAKAA